MNMSWKTVYDIADSRAKTKAGEGFLSQHAIDALTNACLYESSKLLKMMILGKFTGTLF